MAATSAITADRDLIGILAIALAHGPGGGYRRRFAHAQKVQRKLAVCSEVLAHSFTFSRFSSDLVHFA